MTANELISSTHHASSRLHSARWFVAKRHKRRGTVDVDNELNKFQPCCTTKYARLTLLLESSISRTEFNRHILKLSPCIVDRVVFGPSNQSFFTPFPFLFIAIFLPRGSINFIIPQLLIVDIARQSSRFSLSLFFFFRGISFLKFSSTVRSLLSYRRSPQRRIRRCTQL